MVSRKLADYQMICYKQDLKTWIRRGDTYTRLLETHMEAHQLDVDSRRLRIQIHKQTTRGQTDKNNVAVVHNENGLGRNELRRYYPKVEL